jgi:geranylgeranyl pyrophosphate synthase
MNTARREATEVLNATIKNTILDKFKTQFGLNPKTINQLFHLIDKRFEKGQSFRPYYIKVLFDYIKDCMKAEDMSVAHLERERMKNLYEVELPFIAETIIIIQYLDNHILDNKFGISENDKKLKETLISGNLLKEHLWEYIDELPYSSRLKRTIRKYVRKIFVYVDYGQKIEMDWNRYHILKDEIKATESPFGEECEKFIDFTPMQEVIDFIYSEIDEQYHHYLENYLKRIYLTTGALFILLGELLLELTQYHGKEESNIKGFVRCYGLLSQIVNDNCDVVPSYLDVTTNSKIIQDAFSDLKNKNVTLPLLFHIDDNLEHNTVIELIKTDNSKITKEQEETIFEEIKDRETIYKSISIGRLFAEKAKTYINKNITTSNSILNILSIAGWNKFYYEIYQIEGKFYKPTTENEFRKRYLPLKKTLKSKLTIKEFV